MRPRSRRANPEPDKGDDFAVAQYQMTHTPDAGAGSCSTPNVDRVGHSYESPVTVTALPPLRRASSIRPYGPASPDTGRNAARRLEVKHWNGGRIHMKVSVCLVAAIRRLADPAAAQNG